MRTRIALTILLLAGLAWTGRNCRPTGYYGRALEVADPRAVAMGGVTVVVGSPFGFLANPALGVVGFDRLIDRLSPTARS